MPTGDASHDVTTSSDEMISDDLCREIEYYFQQMNFAMTVDDKYYIAREIFLLVDKNIDCFYACNILMESVRRKLLLFSFSTNLYETDIFHEFSHIVSNFATHEQNFAQNFAQQPK